MNHSFIPLAKPVLGGNEWRYVKECLDTGWVSTAGPFIGRFEKALAKRLGVENAVAVSSGTAALHTAFLVAGIRPGDEVIAPSLTFIAPINAIRYVGAVPVFMDVSNRSWHLDCGKFEEFLKNNCEIRANECFNKNSQRKISAIVVIHILGLCCDMDPILDLAKKYHLKVIEDAAEGMGVLYKGKPVGTLGDVGTYSFNGNKVMTAGGGGAVIARGKKELEHARYLTTQAKDDPIEYVHNEVGFNYRLTNLQAAVALAQLEQLDAFIAKKRQIASYYEESFRGIEELTWMPTPSYCEPTYWLSTLLLGEKRTLEQRKKIIENMNDEGVQARPFWHPIYKLSPYAMCESVRMENTMDLYRRGVCLPSSVDLNGTDLQRVTEVFRASLAAL